MPIADATSQPIDLAPYFRRLVALVWEHPLPALAWLGTALRVCVYLQGRGYWMDEGSLLGNLQDKAPFDFTGPLMGDQLAPPGFLAAERFLIGLLGASPYATRLIPMACGIASLWIFRYLAAHVLVRPAAVVAMIFFALSDDLTYYSNELKPYSTDLAVGLLITLLTILELRGAPDVRRRIALAVSTIAAPWFSFASVFVAAGCGGALVADRLASGRRGDAGWLLATGVFWAAGVLLVHRISSGLLGPATSMYVFWDFAFFPMPPRDGADLAKGVGILLETFVTPLNLVPRFMPYAFGLTALALCCGGAFRLGRRDAAALASLALPILLVLAASAVRRYPFHGRLILWTAPALFLFLAEGIQTIRGRRGTAWYAAVLAFLLTYPTCTALYQAIPPHIRDFNPHGDLRRNIFMD